MRKYLSIGSIIWIACFCSMAWAQDRSELPAALFSWSGEREGFGELESIITDRPNFTEAVSTVGKDVAQIESGYTFYKNGDAQAHSWGEPLLRYGILYNWLELRIGLVPLTEFAGTSSISYPGNNDVYLGTKLALTRQEGLFPKTSVIGQCIVPAGFGSVPGNTLLPGVNYLYGWDITDKLWISGSSQIDRAAETGRDQYVEFAQSANAKLDLTDEISSYVELFSLMPHGASEKKPEYYFDTGLQYLITKDLQADMRIGTGLNTEADDLFAGAGLSMRFH